MTSATESPVSVSNADRSDEFSMDFPDFLMPSNATSGHLVERLHMPAANLIQSEPVMIPAISGTIETLRYSNRDGTSEFLSALSPLPENQALAQAAGALSGVGWTILEVRATDACILAKGDVSAPSAIMAVHAQASVDGGGQTVLTIIARSAGPTL